MVLITPKTAAETTSRINVSASQCPVTFVATGIGAGESVAFQITADNGASWEALKLSGAVTLSSTNNVKGFYAPLVLRLVKGITAAPVGVAMYVNDDGTGIKL